MRFSKIIPKVQVKLHPISIKDTVESIFQCTQFKLPQYRVHTQRPTYVHLFPSGECKSHLLKYWWFLYWASRTTRIEFTSSKSIFAWNEFLAFVKPHFFSLQTACCRLRNITANSRKWRSGRRWNNYSRKTEQKQIVVYLSWDGLIRHTVFWNGELLLRLLYRDEHLELLKWIIDFSKT